MVDLLLPMRAAPDGLIEIYGKTARYIMDDCPLVFIKSTAHKAQAALLSTKKSPREWVIFYDKEYSNRKKHDI